MTFFKLERGEKYLHKTYVTATGQRSHKFWKVSIYRKVVSL